MMRVIQAVLMLVLASGCVTTTTGPEPASPDVQLQAHLNLARGYLEQRSWNRAREPLERAIRIDSRSAEAYALMGVMYQGQKEPELADDAYRRALRYDPQHVLALNNYATFLYGQERYQEAAEKLRVLVRNPDYRERPRAYESLGLTELKVGNPGPARDAFQRALSFNEVLPRSSLELAKMAFDEGDYRTAGEYYDMFRSRARQTPGSLCLGIRLARLTGNEDQAASYALALRNLYPSSEEAVRCIPEG